MTLPPVRSVGNANHVADHNAIVAEFATKVPKGSIYTNAGPDPYFDLRGTQTGQDNGNKRTKFNFLVEADDAEQRNGVNGMTGDKVDGLNVIHIMGGSGAYGGRHAIEANLLFTGGATNAANTDRNYAGMSGQFIATNGDGGTSTVNFKGAGFGGGFYARLMTTALYFSNLTGAEFNTVVDTNASERVNYLSGIQIACANAKRGFTYDCGIAISGLTDSGVTHIGFKDAILIGSMNGVAALAADSNVIRVINTANLTGGFDFQGTTFSGSILKTAKVDLTEASLTIDNANGNIKLDAAGGAIEITGIAVTPYIDFKNALIDDYDIRFLATAANQFNIITASGTPGLQFNGTKVIGARVTGYTNPMTGTVNRATTYDTATVTLAQLAGRVMALQADMTAHGLIGP